ncbi:glutaredoxin domain-containing cysteine-rich protein CG12206-like [Rhopilema esculentum]|uniref:glutaredoxin domain-containing cysteine-rich protein CG12206-like n=1 Tax=Rhopilema esculentum TaxID=499914 RepID=UPI0031D11FC6
METTLNENEEFAEENNLSFDGQVIWTENPLFPTHEEKAGNRDKECITNHYLHGNEKYYKVEQSGEFDSSVKSGEFETESGYCETVSVFSELSSPEQSTVSFSDGEDDDDSTQDVNEKFQPVSISTGVMSELDANSNVASAQILSSKGTVRGVKNRVRDNIMHFFSGTKSNAAAKAKRNVELSCEEDPDYGKVIIYTTSLGLVRKTQYECKYVKQIFYNLLVRFDEKDLFVHPNFKKELQRKLGTEILTLPQVFINGQSIGGAKDVEKMIETGTMKDFLVNVKRVSHAQSCPVCGGYKFISCNKCSGSGKSRRTRISREINSLKCSACSNGVVSCPECNS